MTLKKLRKTIYFQKLILNILLIFLSPNNSLVVYLSQKLDKHVSTYQYIIYKKYKRKKPKRKLLSNKAA